MDGYEKRSLQRGLMSDIHHSSTRNESKQEQHQTFNMEFPMPEPPKPNFSSTIYTASESLFNNHYTYGNRGFNNDFMTTSSGLVFRSADSTNRAMREIENKQKEARIKKKAALLAMSLVVVAVLLLNMTRTEEAFLRNTQDEEAKGSKELSKESQLASQIQALELNELEPPPEEEVIEDGKEYLQPFRYFADTITPRRQSDSNFFFHIPRSGGSAIKEIAGKCLGKTLAAEVGVRDGHQEDILLQKVEIDGASYVNVDTTSIDGLHRAANLGLAASGLSDMIASSYFEEVGMLFDLGHKGRAFTIFRHPIERAVSHYWFATRSDRAYIDPSVSIEDYAQGQGIENNWVVRFITGKMEGEITKEHLEMAKEILRRKFLVGFLDDGEETIYRVMKYYDWAFDNDETKRMQQEDCIRDLLKDRTNVNDVEYELPERGSQANALIKWQTQFDIKLYEYAKELFDEQTKDFGSKARKKILRKKKKEGK